MSIEVADLPLSKIMQNLTFRYTRHFNNAHNRSGPLFRGRFKAILFDPDEYLCDIVRYIHNNPVRNTNAQRASNGKHTSHAGYLNKTDAPAWLSTQRVLDTFKKTDKASRKAFGKYVDAACTEGFRRDLESGAHGAHILGSDKFARKALKPRKSPPQLMSTNQLVKRVCKLEGVKEAALTTDSRARAVSLIRQIITYLAMENNVASMSDMAQRFNRDLTTMSRNQRYFRDKLAQDPHMQKRVKKLKRELITG